MHVSLSNGWESDVDIRPRFPQCFARDFFEAMTIGGCRPLLGPSIISRIARACLIMRDTSQHRCDAV